MTIGELIAVDGAHLLVVDDDVDLLRLLSMRLTANGYRVTTADSAEAALARLAVERPDLVISDVRLPDRDGLALFDEIRRQHASLPVILLTAHGSIPDAVEATSKGVYGYLTKPFDSRALLDKVEQALTLGATGNVPQQRNADDSWRRPLSVAATGWRNCSKKHAWLRHRMRAS